MALCPVEGLWRVISFRGLSWDFNIFITDTDDTLSKFANDTKVSGAAGTAGGKDAIQMDLD